MVRAVPQNVPGAFYAPKSLEELEAFLRGATGQSLLYLAGGTDLVVDINERRLPPCDTLVYLDHIPQLKALACKNGELTIGSGATHAAIAASEGIQRLFPALAEACGLVGAPATRNVGTLGGNVARSSPAGDGAVALLLLDAEVHTLGPEGRRVLEGAKFHLGPRRTLLAPGELITQFRAKLPEGRVGSAYEKLGTRMAMTIAIVSCGAVLALDDAGLICDARLSLGSVAPTPLRAPEAEALLRGSRPSEELFLEAAELARRQVSPIDDIRASAKYRRAMVRALVLRCCRRAWAAAKAQPR